MKLNSRSSRYVLSALALGVLCAPFLAHAATSTIDTHNLQLGFIQFPAGTRIGTIIAQIVNVVLLVAGITAFFYVIYGGFQYLTAGGDPGNVDKARKMIVNALIGVIIISISYALVAFVARLTCNDLNPDGTNQCTSPDI